MNIRLLESKATILFLGQVISGILSLVGTVLMARFCGPMVFGVCIIVVLVTGVAQDFVDFGGASWASRELAANRLSTQVFLTFRRRRAIRSLLLLSTVPLISLTIPISLIPAILFSIHPILWMRTNYLQQHLLVLDGYTLAVKLQILERLLWNSSFFLHFLGFDEYLIFIIPQILGLLVHCLVGEILLRKLLIGRNNDFETFSNKLKGNKSFGVMSIISDITNLDSLLIARATSTAESSQYSLSVRVRSPLTMTFQSIATHIRIESASKELWRVKRALKANRWLFFIGVGSIFCASILMFFFADLILGKDYVGINTILVIGSISAFPIGISAITTSFLSATGKDKFVAWSIFCFTIISLPVTYVIAKNIGVKGAALFLLLWNIITMIYFVIAVIRVVQKLQYREVINE